jgi:D-ribose pyranose/furanose isomerase RbsD
VAIGQLHFGGFGSVEFEIEKKRIKIWRQGTLVGGTILKKWGIMPNQQKDNSLELLHEAEPPYVGLIPDYVDGVAVSIVDQIKSLQNLKDIFAYNMQNVVAVAGVPGFVYDVAQAPKDWEPEQVVYYLKKTGIAFINSKQNGTPAQFNQFQRIDLSLSQSVDKYLSLINWCDSQIDLISGINEARQGVVQGASQAVGVTRSALLQSNMTTAPLFGLFDIFCSRVWNQQARLVKMTWAKKAKYAPIIGDVGVNFLKEDVDLVDDFAIFVESTPKMLDDVAQFQQLIMTALNAGKLDFLQAMTLLKEKDVFIGIEKFRKMSEDAEEKAMQQQQQLMEQQEMMKQEGQQRMLEANQMSQQASLQNQQALQQMKGQQAVQQELLSQRGEFLKETIDGAE